MKKDIKEILSSITPDSTVDEILAYCDTTEDFELIIKSLPKMESNGVVLSDGLKQRAQRLSVIAKEFNAEITTAYIQRTLKISYKQATAVLDWLKSVSSI